MSQQKRHWCATVYAGHIGLDDECSEEEIMEGFERYWSSMNPVGLRYAIAQIERCPQTGNLHIQAYTEWSRSMRRSEVYKTFPASLEPRMGSRDDARDYCRRKVWKGKDKGQVKRLPEIGQWRSEKTSGPSPKQRALDYIRKGFTPAEILVRDPDVYFTHHRSIEACYQLMERAGLSGIGGEEE